MLRYKNSNYNVIFEDGDKVVFVNLLTEAIATVNKEKYNKIKEIMESPNKEWSREYADLKNDLIYGGYLIEENFDEIQHLKAMNYRSRYDASFISFTIMPTMRCNLDCIYCYETHEGPTMDEKTTETVANYISTVAKSKRRIHIGWFGGEPLLKFDTMKYINEKVIKACEEYKTNFSSSISTNGYLLSAEKAKLFDELMIRNVQITLDGPKEYHDKYRP
ncbi:radical SAM protein [Petrotoga sp. 8T1HF07.NaAc.6.1]|nr:radical SAM protein [Petrotoga sp. 8T1HF07.NaAc.6.1]